MDICQIKLRFDQHFETDAVEKPGKYQSDTIIQITIAVASRLHAILT